MTECKISKMFSSKVILGLGIIISVILGVTPAIMVIVQGNLIDYALNRDVGVYKMIIAMIFVTLTGVGGNYILFYLVEKQSIIDGYKKDETRIEHCNQIVFKDLESPEFYKLSSSAIEVASALKELNLTINSLVKNVVQLIAPLVIVLKVDYKICIGIVTFLILSYMVSHIFLKNTGDIWNYYRENIRKSNYFSSLLINREFATERKLWGYRKNIEEKFNKEFSHATTVNKTLGRRRFKSEGIIHFTQAVYAVATIILLLQALLKNKISLGYFTSIFYTANTLLTNINLIVAGIYDIKVNKNKVLPYYKLLAMPTDDTEDVPVFQVPLQYKIEFCNVSFSYPGSERKILENISFVMKSGIHYALVGENGSGKSTIVKLMLGLYEPTSGSILLNGVPLKNYSRNLLNQVFSPVFQDYYKYPISVRENILLGSHTADISDEKIISILKDLSMNDLVEKLKNGLDTVLTPLNEESANLSGGEWQKLAIARCIASDAGIAVLDEPNAALDPIVERTIYNAYREMLKEKTTLFISHRLGAVRVSDKIIVIKDGCVVGNDSHDKLIKECEYYAKLYNTQKGLYDE